MAENVVARKQSGWRVICLNPDVCKTPMGSSTPPVPYIVHAELSTAVAIANSVRSNGYPVVVYDQSYTPQTIGDSPGAAKGIKSGTVAGKCFPEEKSGTVRAEGKYLVRHDDKFGMNAS